MSSGYVQHVGAPAMWDVYELSTLKKRPLFVTLRKPLPRPVSLSTGCALPNKRCCICCQQFLRGLLFIAPRYFLKYHCSKKLKLALISISNRAYAEWVVGGTLIPAFSPSTLCSAKIEATPDAIISSSDETNCHQTPEPPHPPR